MLLKMGVSSGPGWDRSRKPSDLDLAAVGVSVERKPAMSLSVAANVKSSRALVIGSLPVAACIESG